MPVEVHKTITIHGGTVEIQPLESGKNRVRFHPNNDTIFVPRAEAESAFPIALLSEIVAADGVWACEVIARHESSDYVVGKIRTQLNAYFRPHEFIGKRMLDFGCGSGASTFGLAAMLPNTEVVGVELDQDHLAMARRIACYRQLQNVRFLQSPSGSELPADAGRFEFIMLSAVWEHLLPAERPIIARLLWEALKPGGALLINQTPYRWSPFEHHTTGLWGINYLPDRLACYRARHHARETPAELAACDWPQLLRRGIRGGTEWEVLRNIRRTGGRPQVLQPLDPYTDRADVWFRALSPRHRWLKRVLAKVFSITDNWLGTVPARHLDVVIRKH